MQHGAMSGALKSEPVTPLPGTPLPGTPPVPGTPQSGGAASALRPAAGVSASLGQQAAPLGGALPSALALMAAVLKGVATKVLLQVQRFQSSAKVFLPKRSLLLCLPATPVHVA